MSKIKKELKRFLIAGFSAVATDLVTYYILLNFLSHDVAKAISFLLGTILAFIVNKYWTFEKHDKSYIEIVQFAILYTITLGANVVTNKLVLEQMDSILFAFLFATGVSTVLNFLGQKFWVFK
ncbi:GtrA family protein [Aliarcobacter cryaerophilus]|uniref:GtrA family protein n=1 Tax=Aliarcobacter cryaerophilus TaxID=28198 RepID=UPI0021B3A83A|nr:GtrA family protein [Aliarcobacter cryaerophilus]MCT7433180.1 GtrA family protein [Aliarcobacter cryaerophilus]